SRAEQARGEVSPSTEPAFEAELPVAPFDSAPAQADWSNEISPDFLNDLPAMDWDGDVAEGAPGQAAAGATEASIGEFPAEDSLALQSEDEASPESLPGLWAELESEPSAEAETLQPEISAEHDDDFFREPAAENAGAVDEVLAEAEAAASESSGEYESSEEDLEDLATEPEDPFEQYEAEARAEAEKQFGRDEDAPVAEETEAPSFLFDADNEFTTAPIEAHIAGQKKIDHYLSLFDIAREISAIDDFEEFWDSILFSVMAQLGPETLTIFATRSTMEPGQKLFPVALSGYEGDDEWVLAPGQALYDACLREEGIIYAEQLRTVSEAIALSEMERDIIDRSKAQIIAPLKNGTNMYGIVLIGAAYSAEEYSVDDLEFVSLLGGIAGSGVDRILARLEFDRDTEQLKRRDFFHNRILEAARECSGLRNLDELYDVLIRNLTEHFHVDSYSLVLLNPATQEYSIFAGNRISPESIEKFRLRTTSELAGMVSNFTRVFEVNDFRANGEITACYTNDDLGIMKHYWVVPLIYQNWLVGFFTIHSTTQEWTEFDREMAVSFAELIGPCFGGAIMLGERESLFRDPFSPLEDRLRLELKKSFEFHSHLSLAEIRIKNIKRILTLNPSAQVTQFLSVVGKSIAAHLFHTDFLARIGQGRFAIILPGRGKEESEILIKKIRADFKRLHLLPGSPVDAQFVHSIVSTEDTSDPEKMLAILE
ncbi:MAG TPA: GAF domain-containing protein, partial [Leptospiraceae bacterium]|nr:GAF domain-containing protein [Leptospiraceae bacterium]